MAIRKNQATLSAQEKNRFVQAVLALKANGTYDQYVRWHKDMNLTLSGHFGPAFFPWHREFLRRFELDLQKVAKDPTLGLPYWDWSVDNSPTSSIWRSDFLGGNGHVPDGKVMDGPFAFDIGKWPLTIRNSEDPPYLRRQLGSDVSSLLTPEDVTAALNAKPYDALQWHFFESMAG
jgi:tyrosinase